MKIERVWEPTTEQFVLIASIILIVLNIGLSIPDTSPLQQDSTIMSLQILLVSGFGLVSFFAGTALVVAAAIGKLDHRLCFTGCFLLTLVLAMLTLLTK